MPTKSPSKRMPPRRSPRADGALLIRGPKKALEAIAQFTMKSPAGKVVVTDVAIAPNPPRPAASKPRRRDAKSYEVVAVLPGGEELTIVKIDKLRPDATIRGPKLKSMPAPQNDESEIIERVKPWAGSEAAARRWYRSQMIPALGDQTAEALVRTGQADLVRRYLDGIAAGGFA